MGYVAKEGKIVLDDDSPVGRGFGVFEYWGGVKQHRRWHMTKPVELSASRNGDPLFMDEYNAAVRVTWEDGSKYEEAMLELLGLFSGGVRGAESVANPLAMKVHWQPAE